MRRYRYFFQQKAAAVVIQNPTWVNGIFGVFLLNAAQSFSNPYPALKIPRQDNLHP
jgi:hypothetical protein